MPPTHRAPRNRFLNRIDIEGDISEIENESAVLEEQDQIFSDQDESHNSSSSSENSDASEDPSEAGELLFNPSLSTQRHQMVLNILKEEKVKSVVDLGCNNLKFLSLAKSLPDIQFLAGVDIDKNILEEYKFRAIPPACKWLEERPLDLLVELWEGDVTYWEDFAGEVMKNRTEVVTSIELIEHLSDIDRFTDVVLGVIQPRMWIVTTPNKDYNELFPNWPGSNYTRHWDHKFEWTRREFQDWVKKVLREYPEYKEVEFGGVGFTDGCELSHGPASQSVVFRLVREWTGCTTFEENASDDIYSQWVKFYSYFMPRKVDDRNREEKILSEVMFHANELARVKWLEMMETEPYEAPDSILVKFDEIIQFSSVQHFTKSIEEIKDIVKQDGNINYDEKDNLGIFISDLTPPDDEEID